MKQKTLIALATCLVVHAFMFSQIIISELYTSVNSNVTLRNEKYVEIHNPMNCAVDLNGWELIVSSNCIECSTTPLDGLTINAGQTLRFSGPDATLLQNGLLLNFAYAGTPGNCNFQWNGQYRDGAILKKCGEIVDSAVPDCLNSSNFYQNERLIRNSNVCEGVANFNSSEWYSIAVSDISELPVTPAHDIVCSAICGKWTGLKNDDWHDCANWSDRVVPTITTDVTIDQDFVNPCAVYTGDAQCKSLNISSNVAGNILGLSVLLGRFLQVQNSVSLSKTDGPNKLIVILNNGLINIGGNLNANLSSGFNSEIEIYLTGNSANILSAQNISLINTGPQVGSQVNIELTSNGGTVTCNDLILSGNGQLNSSHMTSLFSTPTANTIDVNGNIFIQNGARFNHSFGNFYLGQNFFDTNLNSAYNTNSGNVILDGGATQIVSTNGLLLLHNLSMAKTGGELLMQGNIEISNVLSLSDDFIDLNSNELIISNPNNNAITRTTGAAVSESTTFQSEISWDIGSNTGVHEFPFADGIGGTYVPFMFQLTSGSVDRVSLATYGTGSNNLPYPPGVISVDNVTVPGNASSVADRWWYIDTQNESGLMADVTFTWANSESPGGTGIPNAQRFNESSSLWELPIDPTPIFGSNPGSEFVAVQGVTAFSPWGVARPSAPLPVELLSFSAKKEDTATILEWSTASEINNEKFIIERADHTYYFESIGETPGAGNSEAILNYQFIDRTPHTGINYYRLKQVDFDGSHEYSNVVYVNFEDQFLIIPMIDGYLLQSNHPVNARLFDLSGRLIIKTEGNKIELKTEVPGFYLLELSDGIKTISTEKLYFN